ATWLAAQKGVAWVSYPGLPSDKYHNLAQKYVPKGAGAVFTFGLKGGYEAGVKLVSNVKLFSHLANIGDTRSLIIHPASTTHRQRAELVNAQSYLAHALRQPPEQLFADLRKAPKHIAEHGRGHAGNGRRRQRHDSCRARLAVDRRQFAEITTGLNVEEYHLAI